jgi:hypothetical protein
MEFMDLYKALWEIIRPSIGPFLMVSGALSLWTHRNKIFGKNFFPQKERIVDSRRQIDNILEHLLKLKEQDSQTLIQIRDLIEAIKYLEMEEKIRETTIIDKVDSVKKRMEDLYEDIISKQ